MNELGRYVAGDLGAGAEDAVVGPVPGQRRAAGILGGDVDVEGREVLRHPQPDLLDGGVLAVAERGVVVERERRGGRRLGVPPAPDLGRAVEVEVDGAFGARTAVQAEGLRGREDGLLDRGLDVSRVVSRVVARVIARVVPVVSGAAGRGDPVLVGQPPRRRDHQRGVAEQQVPQPAGGASVEGGHGAEPVTEREQGCAAADRPGQQPVGQHLGQHLGQVRGPFRGRSLEGPAAGGVRRRAGARRAGRLRGSRRRRGRERPEDQAQQGPDGDDVAEVHPCSEGRCGEPVEQP